MNEVILPSVSSAPSPVTPGVYADLASLVKLQFQANGFSFGPRQPVRSLLSGKHASRLRGRGLNFEEIRRYLPGDDVRQIDWKVTARTRKPHVRTYTEERERTVLLVVDQRLGMFFGSRLNFKSVTAAEAAALAAWRVISFQDLIGAVVFNDSQAITLSPSRSRVHIMRLLQTVIDMNHQLSITAGIVPGPAMLNRALDQASRLATHDQLVCLITDGNGRDEETRQLLTRISRHNDVLTLLVNDPLEVELPDAGSLVFASGSRQIEVDTSSQSLRDSYRSTHAEAARTATDFLSRREVPILTLSTAEPVVDQLRRILGKRLHP